MTDGTHLTLAQLEAGLDHIRQAPREAGTLRMIVRRPRTDQREVLEQGELSLAEGLVGDKWKASPDPEAQVTLMNARAADLVTRNHECWPLAGDQLYVDLDLSDDHLPPGSRLAIGAAVIEVSAQPHLGCHKFSARFGVNAVKFVNSTEGKRLRLRGINAKVVQAGIVRVGDVVRKVLDT